MSARVKAVILSLIGLMVAACAPPRPRRPTSPPETRYVRSRRLRVGEAAPGSGFAAGAAAEPELA